MMAKPLIFPAPTSGTPRIPARAAAVWLTFCCLAIFLPGLAGLPLIDRDEPRFMQASRQMIETGDYVSIRYLQDSRNQKPIGIYWLQVAAVRIGELLGAREARSAPWLYRLPSVLGATATALLTFWAGLALLSVETAAVAALLTASTVLLNVEARLATTDAVLAACTVAAMGAMLRVRLHPAPDASRRWLWPAIFWTALAAGILVKGPIAPGLAAVTAVTLCIIDRSGRWILRLRPGWGLAWLALLAAPWLVTIELRTQGRFLADSLGREFLARASGARETHWAPFGTYFAEFWLAGWPLAPFAAVSAPFVLKKRHEPAFAFLLAWLVPAWLALELAPTKLPHYALPLYPAAALLVGLAIERGGMRLESRWRRVVLAWGPALVLLGAGAVAALSVWRRTNPGIPALVAAPLIAWRVSVFLRRWSDRDAPRRARDAALLAWFALFALFAGVGAAPVVRNLLLSSQLDSALQRDRQQTGCPQLAAITTTYREPSLVFAAGSGLAMTLKPADAAAFLAAGACRVAIVRQSEEQAFTAALPNAAGAPLFQRLEGLDLGNAAFAAVDLWTRGRTASSPVFGPS